MYMNVYLAEDRIWLWDDNRGLHNFPAKEYQYAYRKNPRGQHIAFTGERCSKTTRFVKQEPDVFESDLPLETRVLTDIYLDDDTPSIGHRVCMFDIEVSMEDELPNVETANNPVTAVTFYDKTTDGYHALILGEGDDREEDNVTIRFFSEEYNLLSSCLDVWEYINPTIITGWNIDQFDVPYLYRRLQNILGYSQALRVSPINKVKFSNYRKKYQIAGVSSLDYLDLYKKFTYTELPNYRLDTVGEIEVGMKKIEYEGTLDELYRNDLEKFITYSIRDVEIIAKLDEKLKLIELVRGICHIGHVPYEDYCYSSRFLEGTIVTYLHRKGLIVTDRDPQGRELMDNRADDDLFKGAYVKTPNPSKYDWLYSLDLQSLYPSIIMSLNISPETKVGRVINWNSKKYIDGQLENISVEIDGDFSTLNKKQFGAYIKENNLAVSSNGILYRQDKRGVIPAILEKWFDERVEYKDLAKKYSKEGDDEQAEFYNRRQHIQKIFLNSLYGVLGLPVFRFFDLDNALAVTAVGQDVIKNSEVFVNNLYEELGAEPRSKSEVSHHQLAFNEEAIKRKEKPETAVANDWCIYIDTDSLYFSSLPLQHKLTGDIKDVTIKFAKFVEKRLNDYYDEMSVEYFNCIDHKFHIKGETIAKTAIWIVKKRYAMLKIYDLESDVDIEPKMVVKGLDIVRSSFPIKFKEYMKDFIISLLKDTSKEDVDRSLLDFYTGLTTVPPREIARNTAVKHIYKHGDTGQLNSYGKGAPMHVKATINYNQLLREYGIDKQYMPITDGEKIKYVMLKDNPYRLETVAFKDYEDPPQIQQFVDQYCDHHKMFESELKKKLKDFYNAMNWGELPMDVNLKASEFFSF